MTFILPIEETVLESGWILPSGESNYADQNVQNSGMLDENLLPLSGQMPRYYSGIDKIFPSPSELETLYNPEEHDSGILYSGIIETHPTNPESYAQITGTSGEVDGILDSAFSDLKSFSKYTDPFYANIGVFFPYIHYYPRWEESGTSNFDTELVPKPFKVDYSLSFSQGTSYNNYTERSFDYEVLDEDGEPIFDDDKGKPPLQFG